MNQIKYELSDIKFYFLIVILLILAYFPSFTGDLIGDDVGRLAIFSTKASLGDVLTGALGDRPVLVMSLWLDNTILKLTPGLMRLETILFVGLIAIFLRKIVNNLNQQLKTSALPFWRDAIIILFCLHPLHTQAITHIVQRGIIFSTLGGLIATLLLLKCRFNWKHLFWRVALLAWIIALLSKPNIAFLAAFWVPMALCLDVKKRDIYSLSVFFLMLLIPIVGYKIGGYNVQEVGDTASLLIYFSVQAKALLIYAKLILVPYGLSFNHDIGLSMNNVWWPGLILWVAYFAIILSIFLFAKNKAVKFFSIGCLLSFLPESSFFPIMHPIFEHRTFLPMAFMAMTLIFLIGTVEVKRWHFATFFSLLLTSIGLSLIRNSEAQKYSTWAEKEIGQTCFFDFMQLHFLERLIINNNFVEARRGLDKLKKCQDKTISSTCFEAIYEYTYSTEFNSTAFDNLKNCVHSNQKIAKLTRASINSIVVKKSIDFNSSIATDCLMEDFFSAQLRAFKEDREFFGEAISFYTTSAEGCLKRLETRNENADKFQSLKIRTIKRYHFGVPDERLADDLAKAPQTPDYDYLRTLLETAPKL